VGDEHHVLAALQPAKALVQHVQNVMAHPQKPDLVFQQNGLVHLNLSGGQFSRLLAVEECGSADKPWTDHVPTYSARLLATHSICIFPLNFPSRASPCAIRFRTAYTHRSRLGVPHRRSGQVLAKRKSFALPVDRIVDRPARSESRYRLLYPSLC